MRISASVFAVVCLCLTGSAWAANTPPGFDPAKWQQLIQETVQKGTPMETSMGLFLTLSRIIPSDASKPHHADYFSTVGAKWEGKYVPGEVSAVSENWKINAQGNWDIDQWVYAVSMTGELLQVGHSDLIETRDGEVLGDQTIATGGPSDPAVLQRWGEALSQWLAQLPASGSARTVR